ncbi:MAG: hypothetical protein M4D85_00490 [Actinomycetota bacterium]|nr:hypothetical protein [Actinomycetota bacterium]
MPGPIGTQLGSSSSATGTTNNGADSPSRRQGEERLVVVPAGFIADIVGGLSGTIGEITGGYFGNARLGRQIGDAASPLIKLLPFQVIPSALETQSTGPDGGGAQGPDEAMIIVPAGFLGGLLGGIGGQLLGGTVGGWLGNKEAGSTVGSTLGGVLGGLLPFQVVPPSLTPQSAAPDAAEPQEPLVVVPAGFFGDLLSGVAGTVGGLIGGDTGRSIGQTASPFLKLLPFQDVPPDLAPQSAGPDGAPTERMVVVPAGFFGNLLSGLAGTVGGAVGGLFGDAKTGTAVGGAAAPLLKLLPFHEVPPQVLPQSAAPDPGAGSERDKLMLVPAGLFGSLLSCWSGTIGTFVGDLVGDARTGDVVGKAAQAAGDIVPFSAVPQPRPSRTPVPA